jgi:hypothetical protein
MSNTQPNKITFKQIIDEALAKKYEIAKEFSKIIDEYGCKHYSYYTLLADLRDGSPTPTIEFLVNNESENGYKMGFNLKLLTVEIENISVDESLEFQIMEQLEESLEKLKEIVSLD